jgi:hypothetical protein
MGRNEKKFLIKLYYNEWRGRCKKKENDFNKLLCLDGKSQKKQRRNVWHERERFLGKLNEGARRDSEHIKQI